MIPDKLLERARLKAPDTEYQAYVRLWPSILTNDYREWLNGDGRSVFAHHREVSAGSGIAHKPEYCGYPLTQEQHANTHQHGLSYYNPPEWWQKQAIKMLANWVNGVRPPELPEKRTKETYIIESAEHLRAFQEMLTPYFKNSNAKPVEIIIQTGKKRTNAQNRSMWGVIYGDIIEFYIANPIALGKDVAEYVMNFQPSIDFIHEMMKGLCNRGESTAKLKKQEHCNYFDRIATRFMEKHEHEVKMPVNERGFDEFY
jgi:hypothetical protein